MAFRASLCAAAHNGSTEFIERNDQLDMAVRVGWSPSKEASIQHFFRFGCFHFAPTSSSAIKSQSAPLKRKPRTSQRAVSAVTKMSIAISPLLFRRPLIYLKKTEYLVIAILLGSAVGPTRRPLHSKKIYR